MNFLKKMSLHFKLKSLQNQFDHQISEVQRLLSEKNVEASGKALLEAEALRKEIKALSGDENPD